jgi:hypothetical protein
MPRQQLNDFQHRLGSLKTCFALAEPDLDASPVCPHCNFRLVIESDGPAIGQVLKTLEDELENLHGGWTRTLLSNLEDPATQQNLPLLKSAPRKIIEGFVKSRVLPDDVTPEFVAALQEALSGLAKVIIAVDTLRSALLAGGSPSECREESPDLNEQALSRTGFTFKHAGSGSDRSCRVPRTQV